ncbi:hypothetical protein [Kordiimonas aquimaris]|uniref:hypothetical protein n=1 Tax=Kordiimonas aquimaris TaxID=707591 RepID=UPI0021D3E2E3|nr:hypothetical protein [Kordiimonas aquimaris]
MMHERRIYTGLNDPLLLMQNAARIGHIAEWIRIYGSKQPYVIRNATEARDLARVLVSMAGRDYAAKSTPKRTERAILSSIRYLERCEVAAGEYAGFEKACYDARKSFNHMHKSLCGGWHQKMFPMLDNGTYRKS